jgi:hypothetical protein
MDVLGPAFKVHDGCKTDYWSQHQPVLQNGVKPRAPLQEPVFVSFSRSPGIDSQPGGLVRQPYLQLVANALS